MHHGRFTIARLLGSIMFFGIVLAGLRSGSNDWFKLMLYRLEAGRFASRLKARLPDEQRPSTPHAFLVGGLPLARRLLTMPPSRLR